MSGCGNLFLAELQYRSLFQILPENLTVLIIALILTHLKLHPRVYHVIAY